MHCEDDEDRDDVWTSVTLVATESGGSPRRRWRGCSAHRGGPREAGASGAALVCRLVMLAARYVTVGAIGGGVRCRGCRRARGEARREVPAWIDDRARRQQRGGEGDVARQVRGSGQGSSFVGCVRQHCGTLREARDGGSARTVPCGRAVRVESPSWRVEWMKSCGLKSVCGGRMDFTPRRFSRAPPAHVMHLARREKRTVSRGADAKDRRKRRLLVASSRRRSGR